MSAPVQNSPQNKNRSRIVVNLESAPAETPYDTDAPLLPKSLAEAVALLRVDPFFRDAFGAEFVDYYARLKTTEIERFQAEVTDWEQREYFELF